MHFPFLCAAAAAAFLPSSDAWAFRRTKRAAWVPSDPKAFEVNLGFDNAGRYIAPIGMGKPWASAGNFSFVLSTSSPYTAVAAADCASCAAQVGQAPVYNISKSGSALRQQINQTFEIGTGSVSGEVISENCSFKKSTGGVWAYDNQTVLMIKDTAGILAEGVSGFVGLGRSTGNDSYISGIINSQGWKNLTFGFAFNAFNASAANAANATAAQSGGAFTVRELNPAMFSGEINWHPVVRASGVPKNVPADWAINFDSYKIKFGDKSINYAGGVAIIDPYFQELRIPQDEALDFFGNIPNAKMTNDSSSLSWAVPCDQDLSLSVTAGNNTFRLKKDQLVSFDSTGTVCTSLVKAWSDPAVRVYLFGSPFVSIAYIAYNAQKDPSSDQIGLAPRSAEIAEQGVSKTVLIAAVAGSVICTVFIISAILFVFYHRRRGSDTTKPSASGEEKHKIEPFTAGAPNSARAPNSATPMLTTTGNYIIEQGPIGGEPNEASVLTNEPAGSPRSPLTLDGKRAGQSPQNPSMRQSQYADFTPTSATTPHLASLDSKRARSESHHLSMRQSQFTDVSACTPTSETFHIPRPSPSLDHSFYGPRVTSFHGVPETQPQQDPAPDESAPPPYPAQPDEQTVPPASSSRQKN